MYLPIIGALQTVFLLWGCSGCAAKEVQPNVAVAETQKTSTEPAVPGQLTAGRKLVTDENGTYEIRSTPFGVTKLKIGPPPQVDIGPQDVPAPPVKEAVKDSETVAVHAAPVEVEVVRPKIADPPREMPNDPPAGPEKLAAGGDSGVVFNFDDADLYEVIRTFADVLKINYIVDPGIKGKVTIQTAGQLQQKDIFPIFHQILEANGLAAVKEGAIYNIVLMKDVSRLSLSTNLGQDISELPPNERIVIQIIPLKYISSQEMTKLLTPFISSTGTILAQGESNTLLVMDKSAVILKVLSLVKVFDIDMFDQVQHRFFMLKYANADEINKLIADILSAYKGAAEFKLIPITRLNALLVISKSERIFQEVEGFIKKFDTAGESMEPRIYVYAVKNGKADELTSLLNSIFGSTSVASQSQLVDQKKDKTKEKADSAPTMPFVSKTVVPETRAIQGKQLTSGSAGGGTLRGEIRLVADETRNAIVIQAIPQDYQTIIDILKQVDILPRQVLIEAVIAEISLNDKLDLGMEWTYTKDNSKGAVGDSILSGTLGASGLTYSINKTNFYTSKLATSAQNGTANILASPSILAADNKEATINISKEIPLASSEYTSGSGTDRVITTNVQFRNTGIILTVTPHINEGGLVNMDISQEVSEPAGTVLVSGKEYPSFSKRNVKTNLTVGNDQTIVIAGLIKQTKSESTSGVPFLSRLPYFGFLFGKEVNSDDKTELIAFITPRVIANLDEIDAITHEFQEKAGGALKNRNNKQ